MREAAVRAGAPVHARAGRASRGGRAAARRQLAPAHTMAASQDTTEPATPPGPLPPRAQPGCRAHAPTTLAHQHRLVPKPCQTQCTLKGSTGTGEGGDGLDETHGMAAARRSPAPGAGAVSGVCAGDGHTRGAQPPWGRACSLGNWLSTVQPPLWPSWRWLGAAGTRPLEPARRQPAARPPCPAPPVPACWHLPPLEPLLCRRPSRRPDGSCAGRPRPF